VVVLPLNSILYLDETYTIRFTRLGVVEATRVKTNYSCIPAGNDFGEFGTATFATLFVIDHYITARSLWTIG